VPLVQHSVNRSIGLGRNNDRGPSLADDSRRSMIGKSRIRGGQDFLPFSGGQDDEVAFGAFLGGFVEPAQGVDPGKIFGD
jgi:hypothetical protein